MRSALFLLVAAASLPSIAAELPLAVDFARDIRPLLTQYCADCHGKDSPSGGVDFTSFAAQDEVEQAPDLWYDAAAQVNAFTMPPSDSPQPTVEQRQKLIQWLENTVDRLDAQIPRTPGHVPPRRLTRTEYNHSIQDLTGLDIRPADDFPADDTAHGFDTVSDALILPPLLMEKYLAAGEKILEQAIVPSGPVAVLDKTQVGRELQGARPRGAKGDPLRLEAEAGFTVELPADGDYEVRVTCARSGPGDDAATAVLKIDGVDSGVQSITADASEPQTFTALLPLSAGERRLSIRHTWHTATVPKGTQLPDLRLVIDSVRIVGPTRAIAHQRIFHVDAKSGLSDRDAARLIIERFATRAYRRPATEVEVRRLLKLYDDSRAGGKGHIEAVRLPLLAVLVSPQFLFRIERGEGLPDEAGAVRLSDYELASRLSYFLWSAPPDEPLLSLAAESKLQDTAVLESQVQRMLADPRSSALAESFAGQWLGLRRLDTVAPDRSLFPKFDAPLRQAMAAEIRLQFEEVIRGNRSVLELLHADYTFLNEDLARLYGIKGVSGAQMRKVPLTDMARGGVVTTAAVLTLTSHPTRTSPVKRGKWLLDEILGAPPPPPPPDVPELEESPRGPQAATLRERLERHRADPNCFGCHVRMDALGLGLENFDPIGRWRDREEGRPIDATGELPGGERFSSPEELKQVLLAHKGEFARCLSEKVFVYALGRGLQRSDRREVKRIAQSLAQNDWQFSTLVSEVVSSYPFRHRLHDAPAEENRP